MKNQKVKLLVALCCFIMVMAVGCGGKNKVQNTNETPRKESTQTEQVLEKTEITNKEAEPEVKEKHSLEGTLAEKKDFMFVVEDGEKKPNAFAFSEKPAGYDDLKVNDKVIVEYTGEISEVDAFTGEVISVTKSNSK